MKNNKNEKEFIIDQIQKAGFTLERYVVNLLVEGSVVR